MKDFLEIYASIVNMALEGGVEVLSRVSHLTQMTSEDKVQFLRGCHRGWDKAQNTVFEQLCDITEDPLLSENQKDYRSLLLRKIIDSIVFTILRGQLHVVRRLALHDFPPGVNLEDTGEILSLVNKLNQESRMTFAVSADLTTPTTIFDIR